MKLTETKLRSIIQEELNEMGGGEDYGLYQLTQDEMNKVFAGNGTPSDYGLEIKTMGSPKALTDWANRKQWVLKTDPNLVYGGYFVERGQRGRNYYFIDKAI